MLHFERTRHIFHSNSTSSYHHATSFPLCNQFFTIPMHLIHKHCQLLHIMLRQHAMPQIRNQSTTPKLIQHLTRQSTQLVIISKQCSRIQIPLQTLLSTTYRLHVPTPPIHRPIEADHIVVAVRQRLRVPCA